MASRTTTVVTCDRCEREIGGAWYDHNTIVISGGQAQDKFGTAKRGMDATTTADLCATCVIRLYEWWAKGKARAMPGPPESPCTECTERGPNPVGRCKECGS
jgi:hypothetical protein